MFNYKIWIKDADIKELMKDILIQDLAIIEENI